MSSKKCSALWVTAYGISNPASSLDAKDQYKDDKAAATTKEEKKLAKVRDMMSLPYWH